MRTTFACLAACLGLLLPAVDASADPFDAYTATITTGTTGNGKGRQTLRNFTLGLDFEVLYPTGITIFELGIWDDKSGDGLLSPHTLSLWDLSDTSAPLATINTLPGTGALRNGYRYFELGSPVYLGGGTKFAGSAYYPSTNADSNGNSGPTPPSLGEPVPIFNGNGLIANIGVARYTGGSGFPGTSDTGPANRYHSFSFSYQPTPEPGTLLLLGSALAGAGVLRRRRRKTAG